MIQEGYEIAGSSEETLEQLRTQGYANLEFGLGRPACEELFTGFKHLVALTEEPGGDKIVHALTFTRTT